MFDFLQGIANFLSTIVDTIIGMVENFVMVVTTIVGAFSVLGQVQRYLPAFLGGVVLAYLTYSIVINLLNKGG